MSDAFAGWLYEAGIGEERAIRVADGRIIAARIMAVRDGPRVGGVVAARLTTDPHRAIAADGTPIRLIRPTMGGEGQPIRIAITRAAIWESGRRRPAHGEVTDAPVAPGPDLRALIDGEGPVRRVDPHAPDAFEAAGWGELLEEARTGDIAFPGGMLHVDPTRAMTTIDVDGDGPSGGNACRVALAAVPAIAATITRHGLAGVIAIDFPTLTQRADRHAVAMAMDAALTLPAERTGINGFGLMQLVVRRRVMSLPERMRFDPEAATRARLRFIERAWARPGPVPLPDTADRALFARHPDLLAELCRRTGRPVPG